VPQDRLRSPRAGIGRKTTSLSDFEYRVWDQFQLSADDFGVMRCSALTIQDGNDNLATRNRDEVQAALEKLIAVGLAVAFEHQGRQYMCDPTWQTFQHVEYPKATILPKPTGDALKRCDERTRKLFTKHPGGRAAKKPNKPSVSLEQFQNGSGTLSEHPPATRAGGREEANANANATAEAEAQEESPRETDDDEPVSDAEPVWTQRRPGAASGDGLIGDHRRCRAFTAAACARGVCVPPFLADQWVQQLDPGHHDRPAAEVRIAGIVTTAVERLPDGAVGDALGFWRDTWRATHGRAVGKVATTIADWRGECEDLHGGRCGNATFHHAQMQKVHA
jgi:hypothetical protein